MATPARAHVEIQAIADRLEPTLRRQFLAAVEKLRRRISIDAIVKAIARGEVTIAITGAITDWPRDLRPAVRTLNQVFASAAMATAHQVRPLLRVPTAFNLVNPLALEAADTRTSLLVREIGDETRRALQVTIRQAIETGQSPKVVARVIRSMVGLTERQAAAVMKYQLTLLAQGAEVTKAAVAAQRYSATLLNRRAEMIARTETVRASNDGQLEVWRRAQAQGLIALDAKKRWIVTPDDRLCPRCAPLQGIEVLLSMPFPGGVLGPPLHPQCRCALRLAAATMTKRRAA